VLSGIASSRAATHPTPKVLHQLEKRLGKLRSTVETRLFHENARRYREVVNQAYAGPRLAAAISAAQVFMPPEFWSTYLGNHAEILPFYEAETAAIAGRDPAGARAACVERSAVLGRIMLTELIRRRVLGPDSTTDGALATF
jgi:DNA-binding GntR family transcriptional regulator